MLVCLILHLLLTVSYSSAVEDMTETCLELPEYLEFVNTDIRELVVQTLEKTVQQYKQLKNVKNVLIGSVQQLWKISDKILDRINGIKRGDVLVCEGKVNQLQKLTQFRREISKILNKSVKRRKYSVNDFKDMNEVIFTFKSEINQEVTRLMMLPETNKQNKDINEECNECKDAEVLLKELENLRLCKDGDKKEDPNCMTANKLLKHMLNVSDNIDDQIKDIFIKMRQNGGKDGMEDKLHILQGYKNLKNQIEEIVGKMLYNKIGSLRLTNIYISRSIKQVTQNLKSLISKCHHKCGKICNNCGVEAIKKAKKELYEFKNIIETRNYVDIKDLVKESILENIDVMSDEMNIYKRAKVMFNKTSKCEDEKYSAKSDIRDLFWSFVNKTIGVDDKKKMVLDIDATINSLDDNLDRVCGKAESSHDIDEFDISNCEQAEYDHASDFISQIDKTLKTRNINIKEGKTSLMLGYLDLQSMLNTRVSELFQDQLCCPQEVQSIKMIYMAHLSWCLHGVMDENYQQRECLRNIRKVIEARREEVLLLQIQQGLDNTTRNCPCACKNAARQGQCLPSCEKYSGNTHCCYTGGRDEEQGEELTTTTNDLTTIKPPNSNLDKRYRSDDGSQFPDFISDGEINLDTATNSLSEDMEITTDNNGQAVTIPTDEVEDNTLKADEDWEISAKPLDTNQGTINQTIHDQTENEETNLVTDSEQIETPSQHTTINTNKYSENQETSTIQGTSLEDKVTGNVSMDEDIFSTMSTQSTIENLGSTLTSQSVLQTSGPPNSQLNPPTLLPPTPCPLPCQSSFTWSSCPSSCSLYQARDNCCLPACPAKCTRRRKSECVHDGVEECSFVPGCCPDKYDLVFGDVSFQGQWG